MQTRSRHFSACRELARVILIVAGCWILALPLRAGLYLNTISPGSVPWPGGVVPYEWDISVPVGLRPTYLAGLREWELAANIQFVQRTSEAVFIRLKYDPNAPSGSYSASPPTLTMVNLSRRLVCHESGHALGLEHEHSRPDRDTFITVFLSNIIPASQVKFAKFSAGAVTMFGAYDFESVMHYQRTEYSIAPATLSSMTPNPPNEVLYFNRLSNVALSAGDRATVAFLYGAGPVLSSVVTNTQDTGAGSLRAAIYHANDNPGTTITFAIPNTDPGFAGGAYTIKVTGHLPALTANGTVINGASQAGYAGTTNNVVLGNYIGTNSAGTAAVGNANGGVIINPGVQGNTIGGGNVISGNSAYGVLIIGSGASANTVTGNLIGLNAAGTAALGNAWTGVALWGGATNNTVGGGTPDARNCIAGNLNYGLIILDAGTTGNVVAGNFIGAGPDGTAAGNAFAGVAMWGGAKNNLVGGGSGEGNRITASGWDGVALYDAATERNSVLGNQIFGNGGAGIGNYTATGTAAPVITSASIDTATHVNGSFIASGTGSHRVEFFANPPPGDEGRFFIGSIDSSTGTFAANLAALVPASHRITATVTGPAGDTSPFSAAFTPAVTDTDLDGMPNAYESAHGLVNGVNDANADADRDGQSNIAEMFAGTDPQSAPSKFQPLRIVMTPDGAEVFLDAPIPGKVYRFEFSDALTGWQTLAFGLVDLPSDSDPGQILVNDRGAVGRPRRFYRAVIEP